MDTYCATCGHHREKHHPERDDCVVSTCWCSTFVPLVSPANDPEKKIEGNPSI